MNRRIAASTIILCSIMLPVAVSNLVLGNRSFASMRPENACLWILGTLACALVGTMGAIAIAKGDDDLDDE